MNYLQIANLYRLDDWGRCLSNKIGTWFEVLETYVYDSDIGPIMTIPKGMRMKLYQVTLGPTYYFTFEEKTGFRLNNIGFGRSRLLKLKLKELQSPNNSRKDENA